MTPPAGEFFKMTAAGNDFVLFDNRERLLSGRGLDDMVRRLCARALCVGADGVVVLERSSRADLLARFFNADGTSTFCGNGARCAARLAYLKGMAPARMTLETGHGLHRAEVTGRTVSVEMPEPRAHEEVEVEASGRVWRGTLVNTGVPHFVLLESVHREGAIEPVARPLRFHPRFAPDGANVDFVAPDGEGGHAIRTYERGVERETLACGTGCVAAALSLAAAGLSTSPVSLRTVSRGVIRVRFEGDPRHAAGIRLEGEARLVYVGHLTEEALLDIAPTD